MIFNCPSYNQMNERLMFQNHKKDRVHCKCGKVWSINIPINVTEQYKKEQEEYEKSMQCPKCQNKMIQNHYVDEDDGNRVFGVTCTNCGHEKWDK